MRYVSLLILVMGVVSCAIGCDREEAIVAYQAPKEFVEAPPVTWTLPQGWRQIGGKADMRLATISASKDDPKLLVTVVPLQTGQPLLPNINRWQKQLGAADLTQEQAAQKLQAIDVGGEKMNRIELTGTSETILAAFVERSDHTWYFKLEGETEKVASQKANFDAFVKSLRFEGAASQVEPPPSTSPPQSPSKSTSLKFDTFSADVPPNWIALPPKDMRLAGFKVSNDADVPEVVAARFKLGGFGSLIDNINRWRKMVDLPAANYESETPPSHLKIATGQQADIYDFTGSGTAAKRIRVAMITGPDGQLVYFFRLHGNADAVEKAQADYDAFVQSIRFEK